jgi:hypothetical protein
VPNSSPAGAAHRHLFRASARAANQNRSHPSLTTGFGHDKYDSESADKHTEFKVTVRPQRYPLDVAATVRSRIRRCALQARDRRLPCRHSPNEDCHFSTRTAGRRSCRPSGMAPRIRYPHIIDTVPCTSQNQARPRIGAGQLDQVRLSVLADTVGASNYSSVESAKGQQVSDQSWSRTPTRARHAPVRADHHEERPSPWAVPAQGTPTTPHGWPLQERNRRATHPTPRLQSHRREFGAGSGAPSQPPCTSPKQVPSIQPFQPSPMFCREPPAQFTARAAQPSSSRSARSHRHSQPLPPVARRTAANVTM